MNDTPEYTGSYWTVVESADAGNLLIVRRQHR